MCYSGAPDDRKNIVFLCNSPRSRFVGVILGCIFTFIGYLNAEKYYLTVRTARHTICIRDVTTKLLWKLAHKTFSLLQKPIL